MAKSKRNPVAVKRKKAARKPLISKTPAGSQSSSPDKSEYQDAPAASRAHEESTGVHPKRQRLPGVHRIFLKAVTVVRQRYKLFLGITAVYAVLNLVLVGGVGAASEVTSLKDVVTGEYPGAVGNVSTGFAIFTLLVVQSSNSASDVVGAYQLFLTIITSLALIWALRRVMTDGFQGKVRIRDAFYKGMHPLIPAVLLLMLIVLQLLPLLLGMALFSMVASTGIATSVLELLLWTLPMLLGATLTLYWLTSSTIAVYIVTLPDMTPVKALRSARDLVRYRRLSVLRKLIFLPLILVTLAAIIMVPIILLITTAAPWIFFVLTMLGLIVFHAYLYTLYRELLV